MDSILQLKKSNCKDCYKCIRACPVKSIKFSEHQAHILDDECILCGSCFVVCPQNAKQIRNDVDRVRALLSAKEEVYVSLAPSFIAEFETSGLLQMLPVFEALGFRGAEETAVGAHIVKKEYERLVAEKKQDVIISSCCHSVNLLIQKYYPAALPALAKVLSPMLAHAKLIKERHPGAKVVFIGPCVSKKHEAEEYGLVDAVLTFEELREWCDEQNVPLPASDHLDETHRRARFFPCSGGILRSMDFDDSFQYIAADGVEDCVDILREIEAGHVHHCFIEMSACRGSCIGGPVMRAHKLRPVFGRTRVERFAGNGNPEDFSDELSGSLEKPMNFLGTGVSRPGETAIRETLIRMGKTSPEQELNCGACGYNTCREKAIAVCEGKADISMCLPFMKEKAESFSDTIINNTPNAIIVMDENLMIQQINKAAEKLLNIKDRRRVIGEPIVTILNPVDYVQAIGGSGVCENRHYLAEYDKYVEENIVFDKEYKVVISVMKDVTEDEKAQKIQEERRLNTIEITDQVIEKQMRVVQEIASLLGETTAETKVALTKLKKTLDE